MKVEKTQRRPQKGQKREEREKKWLKRLIENEERLKGDSKGTQKRLNWDSK